MIEYDYVIIGTGIAGCSIAHFLQNTNILLIDKNDNISKGASGAAGAFLSPQIGRNNDFKNLVNKSLLFSVNFYTKHFPQDIKTKGIIKIPKNDEFKIKFELYKTHNDFRYKKIKNGYFFDIGSKVDPVRICENLSKNCDKKFNYEVKTIEYINDTWVLNDEIKATKLIITSGASIDLIKEAYFDIRKIWGQKIEISTSSNILNNYHKECSISSSFKMQNSSKYKMSIGASHHREIYNDSLKKKDTIKLLELANDIKKLNDVKVIDIKVGARASSIDYFPIYGEIINAKATLEKYPCLRNGRKIKNENFTRFKNLYVLNGLGGRGFVLAPYLAQELVNFIQNNKKLNDFITTDRLFLRWARKSKYSTK